MRPGEGAFARPVAILLAAPRPLRVRLVHLAASAAALVVVAGAWVTAVELTPASERPYVSSTSDNSELSLIFHFNALGRLTGAHARAALPDHPSPTSVVVLPVDKVTRVDVAVRPRGQVGEALSSSSKALTWPPETALPFCS